MPAPLQAAAAKWTAMTPVDPAAVHDARLQLHHAAQVANAPAMSYLPSADDDSHTNFEWAESRRGFASQRVPFPQPRTFAFRVPDLTLMALGDDTAVVSSFALAGRTFAEAHEWARGQCEAAGGDASRYTSKKHYEIPRHAVDDGAPFGADSAALEALAVHWANAVRMLDAVAAENPGVSPVRLWPHHFDVGAILTIDHQRSIGLGFTPGDDWYDEPYWYVSPYPAPAADTARPALAGGAHWHDRGWFSAVLTWSAYAGAPDRGAAVAAYLASAIAADRRLLG
jgi:hypothetical protein